MDPKSYFDKIQDYILGQLSPEEQTSFEQTMESNPGLAKEVSLERAMKKTLKEEEVGDFRDLVKQALVEDKPALSPVYLAVSIAASILLVIAVIWWFQSKRDISPTQLADTYLNQYDPGVAAIDWTLRSEDDTLQGELFEQIAPEWYKLNTLYSSADYSAAQNQLQLLRSMDPEFAILSPQEWDYYNGMCQLHLGDPTSAHETLKQVDYPFKEKATFFRALALIQLSQFEEARIVLDSIVALDLHSFKKPAAQLLETM